MENADINYNQKLTPTEPRILTVRGKPVLLDSELAAIYGIETKTLNRAIKRNIDRFLEEFAFMLEPQEVAILKCQIGTSSWGGKRKAPYAFSCQRRFCSLSYQAKIIRSN